MKTIFLTTFDDSRDHQKNVLISNSQNGMPIPKNNNHSYGSLKDLTNNPNVYSDFISRMEGKPKEVERLVLYGHGGVENEEKRVVFGEKILYTAFELHEKLSLFLKNFPNIKQIDLLACNLGVEYKPGISYASELSGYLKKSLSREINIRTFIPSSPGTEQLQFQTESREILREYADKERPMHMMPSQHFAIAEHTKDQHKKREEIARQGVEDMESLDEIMDSLHSLAYGSGNSEKWDCIKCDINNFSSHLSPSEKLLLEPVVELLNTPYASSSREKVLGGLAQLETLREQINVRENKWEKENGFVKYCGHLKTLEQCLRVVPPSAPLLCSTSDAHLEKMPVANTNKVTPKVVGDVKFHVAGTAKALAVSGVFAKEGNSKTSVPTSVDTLRA